ncbi:MAG: CAP domain-containing protein [Oscillospiraceae bacterium]|nr:CAP domain-containing protein [Oscillospiraceae bacterium]
MNLINQERLSLGLTELEFDPMLQNTARIRSKELCQQMSDQDLSHMRPDGSSWSTVLTRDIPIQNLIGAGEILAREKTTDGGGSTQEPIPAKDWFLLWKASQPHYDNITWPEAEKIGVGIYYELRDGEYYTNATVHFGIYADEPAPG